MATIKRPCPNCQGTRYGVDEDLWGLVKLQGGHSPVLVEASLALFVASCQDCCLVQLFNRNTVGEFDKGN